MKVKLASESTN